MELTTSRMARLLKISAKKGIASLKTPRRERRLTKEEKGSKAQYEQYRRRRWCVVKKSQQLKTLCGAKVFVLIEDDVRCHYFSTEDISDNWPTPWEKVVSTWNHVPQV